MSRETELMEAYASLTPENQNMALSLVVVAAQSEAAVKRLYNIQPEAKPEQKQEEKQ